MVRYDDLLNGSGAAPLYDTPTSTALPSRPADGGTDGARAGTGNAKAVMFAWVGLFALLVFAHVITLSVQS